jgi:hypothetical protein
VSSYAPPSPIRSFSAAIEAAVSSRWPRLKLLDVERETKPGKYADGDGLYLIVAGPAAKS